MQDPPLKLLGELVPRNLCDRTVKYDPKGRSCGRGLLRTVDSGAVVSEAIRARERKSVWDFPTGLHA